MRVAAVVAVAAVAFGVLDFIRTQGGYPAWPNRHCPEFEQGEFCDGAHEAAFNAVSERRTQLERDFRVRVWVYSAVAVIATIAGALLLLLRQRSSAAARNLGRNLGTASVSSALAIGALLVLAPDKLAGIALGHAFLPSGAMLVAALAAVLRSLALLGAGRIRRGECVRAAVRGPAHR